MEDNQQSQGGAGDVDSGASTNQTDGQQSQNEQVSKADLKRALDDMHKFKTQAKQAADELAELKKQGLKSQNDYKTLWESTETEKVQALQKADKLKNGFSELLKMRDIELEARKQGIRPEALELLRLMPKTGVVVEVEDAGDLPEFHVKGVEQFVSSLKQKHGVSMFTAAPPVVNGGGGSGKPMANQELTGEYMAKLERTDPKKFRELWSEYQKQAVKRRQALN